MWFCLDDKNDNLIYENHVFSSYLELTNEHSEERGKKMKKRLMLLLVLGVLINPVFAILTLHQGFDFEGIEGTVVPDISGNGLNGTLNRTPTIVEGGSFDGSTCVLFNDTVPATQGAVDYMSARFLPEGQTYVTTGEHTITAWIKRTGLDYSPNVTYLFHMRSTNGIALSNPADGKIVIREDYNNGSQSFTSDVVLPADDKWHFVAVRMSLTNGLYIRVDDTLYTNSADKRVAEVGEAMSVLNIGGRPTGSTYEYVSAYFDDVMFYDSAVTDAELDAMWVPEPCTLLLVGLGSFVLRIGRR